MFEDKVHNYNIHFEFTIIYKDQLAEAVSRNNALVVGGQKK